MIGTARSSCLVCAAHRPQKINALSLNLSDVRIDGYSYSIRHVFGRGGLMVDSTKHGRTVTYSMGHRCKDCKFWEKACTNPEVIPKGADFFLPPAKDVETINSCEHWESGPMPFKVLSRRVFGYRRSKVNNLSGAGYGIRIPLETFANDIDLSWTIIKISIEGMILEIPIDEYFHRTGIVVDRRIGRWMLKHKLAPWEFRQNPWPQLWLPNDGIFTLDPGRRFPVPSAAEARVLHSGIIYKRGDKLLMDGDAEGALKYFDHAITVNGQNAKAWAGKGECHRLMSQNDEARRCFLRTIKLDGTVPDAWVGMGYLIEGTESRQSALKWFDDMIKKKPQSSRPVFGKGCYMDDFGDWDEALKCYNTAQKMEPDMPGLNDIRGLLLKKLGVETIKPLN